MLEADVDDVVFEDGKAFVKGSPESAKTIQEIAGAAALAYDLPEGEEPFLDDTTYYDPPNCTFPFGTHVAVVEVDADTGEVTLERYVAVDDVGKVINPMIVDGQVHGGIAQGIAQALWEGAVYDENGQLQTPSLKEYAIPKADFFPPFEVERTETPTDVNPLGVKGAGETGTIASTPAVVNAVMDALAPLGITAPGHAADAGARLAGDAAGEGLGGAMYTMRPAEFTYHRPTSIDEAISLLGESEDSRLLAGGHSLLPMMKLRLVTPAALVDLGRIPGLGEISANGGLTIGALATHASVAGSQVAIGIAPVDSGDGREDRGPAGAEPRHDRRQRRARGSRGGLPDRAEGGRSDDQRRRQGRRAFDRGRRLLRRAFSRRRSSRGRSSRRSRCGAPTDRRRV